MISIAQRFDRYAITQVRPAPMLDFIRDSQQASIDAAVKAGVRAYIIGEITEQIISAAEVLV